MVRNAWMARVMAACLIPGILLLLTLEVEAAASSAGEIQERIERLADGKSYEGAAFLSERLLGDYSRAKGYLLKQWDQVQSAVDPSHRWRVSVELAHCAARLGEFDEAEAWLARAKAASPERGREEIEKEIALCREWAPRRDGARKGFEASPSIEAARNLLDAYARLEEYAGMQWVMREALSRFPNEPWLESDEFQRTKRFVDAYLTPIPPTSGRQEVPTVPAKDLEIESLFGRLHENRDKRDDLCWGKWKALSLAEKARALKPLLAQPAPREGDWQPSEAEAEMFLRRLGLVGDEAESRAFLRERFGLAGAGLTRDEAAPFDETERSAIQSLASKGDAAVGDLLAKVQSAPGSIRAGREAFWAAAALGRMGKGAIPALTRELEPVFESKRLADKQMNRARLLVQALALTGDLEAIAPLQRALVDLADPTARQSAIQGLEKTSGGLTESVLLQLWEDGDKSVREMAAGFLRERGGEKSLEVLQRDAPTAYAEARRQAEATIWEIKSRLGLDPGDRPASRLFGGKADAGPLYEGIEKSLESPNRGIRMTAIEWLEPQAERKGGNLEPFLRLARTDPVREVRLKAAEAASRAFASQVREMKDGSEDAPQLDTAFDALVGLATGEDEEVAGVVLQQMAHAARPFENKPAHERLVKRVLAGLDSPDGSFRGQCLSAFESLFLDNDAMLQRYVAPSKREAIAEAVIDCLRSDPESEFGRWWQGAVTVARMLRIKEAAPLLIACVETSQEPSRRSSAAGALAEIGDARALPALDRMASTDPFVSGLGVYANREVAWHAQQAIREGSGEKSARP